MSGIREAIRKHLPAPKDILGHAAGSLVAKFLWPALPFLVVGALSLVRGLDPEWIAFAVGMTAGMLLNMGLGRALQRRIRFWKYGKLLEELLEATADLRYGETLVLDAFRRRAKLVLARAFGKDSPHLAELEEIRFARPYGLTSDAIGDWDTGKGRCANLLRNILEELKLP
ncbi:MAG: hypothetical protein HY825_02135 [Acidobacteria bacterium]|nr:hypothetical protein [Acidobacteriota bacterium]